MSSTNGTGRRISVQDAKIKTASVEIKALTVSGKQVTLAVFRQLHDGSVIDGESGHLQGHVWGRVNYHVGCEDRKDRHNDVSRQRHVHVVWQEGDELRKDIVLSAPWLLDEDHDWYPGTLYSIMRELGDAYLPVAVAHSLLPAAGGRAPIQWQVDRYEGATYGLKCKVAYRSQTFTVIATDAEKRRYRLQEGQSKWRDETIREALIEEYETDDYDTLYRAFQIRADPLVEAIQEFRRAYEASWDAIMESPHLFIAV